MTRRGSFRGRSAGISEAQRRKKSWFGSTSSADGGRANTVVISLAGGALPQVATFFFRSTVNESLAESTIIRIRGSIELPSNTLVHVNADLDQQFAFGMCVVSEAAAEVAAVPNPASAEGASWDGWMFYRSQNQKVLDANAGIFDVKAMRKWKSGDAYCLVYGSAGRLLTGAIASDCFISMRTLFLLP